MEVVNKRFHEPTELDLYIGRGSVLGNPYSHIKSRYEVIPVKTREEAIEKYEELIRSYFSSGKESEITEYIRDLALMDKYFNIRLVCHCKHPDREVKCHGDVIKDICKDINNGKYERRSFYRS
jgi:hypothetical protein